MTPPVNPVIKKSDNTVLFDASQIDYELLRFWDYQFISYDETASTALQCWLQYCTLYVPNLERAYDALYADYDPIANYDMTENGTAGEMQDTKTDTTTPTGKTISDAETLGELQTETKNFVAGYDDTTGNGAFSDKQTGSTKPGTGGYHVKTTTSFADDAQTETAHTADNSLTNALLPGSGYNKLNEHHLRRTGNIGVTTSQQMIQSELELRKTELLADFIRGFIKRHFALMGECEHA